MAAGSTSSCIILAMVRASMRSVLMYASSRTTARESTSVRVSTSWRLKERDALLADQRLDGLHGRGIFLQSAPGSLFAPLIRIAVAVEDHAPVRGEQIAHDRDGRIARLQPVRNARKLVGDHRGHAPC